MDGCILAGLGVAETLSVYNKERPESKGEFEGRKGLGSNVVIRSEESCSLSSCWLGVIFMVFAVEVLFEFRFRSMSGVFIAAIGVSVWCRMPEARRPGEDMIDYS